MNDKIAKTDSIKRPDVFLSELRRAFNWVVHHKVAFWSSVVVFLLLGIVFVAVDWRTKSQELALQAEYYPAEKAYQDKKSKFAEALRQSEAAKAKKGSSVSKPESLPSGDMEKDYGKDIEAFSAILEKAPKSNAGKMAALQLSEIYSDHGRTEQALGVLQMTEVKGSPSTLIDALIYVRKASLKAAAQDCDSAKKIAELLAKSKVGEDLSYPVKIRTALCLQSNRQDEARALLTEVVGAKSEDKDRDQQLETFRREARMWLRTIPKANGT
ncbi:MAG: hypothetical protein N2578_03235 [Bdellovibrionaceae bacterium]|nr:hypothetical protein [Pseudobdellovibrionaceae bacterium]